MCFMTIGTGLAAGAFRDLLDIVHLADGLVGILLCRITNETEATAAACITVFDDNLVRD